MRIALLLLASAAAIGYLAGVGVARVMAALDDYEIVLTEDD